MKCKYAGDVNDEYCKGCDGIKMEVDGRELSCEECAGYEPGEDLVEESTENECMNPPEDIQEEKESTVAVEQLETAQKQSKNKKSTNNTANQKKTNKKQNNVSDEQVKKVREEKKVVETTNGVKVVSLRYGSSATIKKGDNYFKFTAEEEWDVSQIGNVEDVREMLWTKLNCEVDKQIEELQNL